MKPTPRPRPVKPVARPVAKPVAPPMPRPVAQPRAVPPRVAAPRPVASRLPAPSGAGVTPAVVAATMNPASSRAPFVWGLVFVVLAGCGFWFVYSGGKGRSNESGSPAKSAVATAKAPAPAVAPAPAAPARAAAPTADDRSRVRARVEAVRIIDTTTPHAERGDFAGAIALLDTWIAANAGHAQGAEIQRHADRLRAAAKVIPSLVEQPAPLIGAQVPVGNSVWPVNRVSGGKLVFKVQAQFGVVERAVEVSSLGEPSVVMLLSKADTARQTAFASTYLLGLGKAAEARAAVRAGSPQAEQLRAGADEVAALAVDGEVLESLDAIGALITRGEFASAQARIEKCFAEHPGHEFLTIGYGSLIDQWRSQIASAPQPAPASMPAATANAAQASDGYPGIPPFTLSTGVAAGDPDRQRLTTAWQWAAANGNWQRHFTELRSTIAGSAGAGPWQQHPMNIDRLLSLATPSLAFEQTRFIRAIGAPALNAFSRGTEGQAFLTWLFDRPAVLAAFNDTIQPRDKAEEALHAWAAIWSNDSANRDTLSGLAIACALVFDVTIKINPDVYGFDKSGSESTRSSSSGPTEVASLARYNFYRDSYKKGSLKVPLAEMMPWELVWVVDAPVPDSELIWAQRNVNFSRREWSKAYGHIRYRMDRATQGVNPYKAYTLAEIEKEGGICGDQAYFAAMTAKANGIPAMVISGEGDRGGHAWFGYEPARNDWNLNTGRYADNYAAGDTRDPQTGASIKEHELRQRTDPVRRTAAYDKSERLIAMAGLLTDAGKRDLATLAYDAALRSAPKNYDAWVAKLDNLVAAKAPITEWLRESARMRTTFREYSDLVQEIDKREAAHVSKNGDPNAARKLVHLQTARMERKDEERTDLILDSVFREADLAAKAGDIEGVGRIYRDALRDKGEEVVAFKRIAARYYGWAKENKQAPDTAKELVAFFDRKHDEPNSDVFAIKAYRGVLTILSGMCKEQALEPLQRRLDRREEKLKELEEKLGKLASKNADR
jgi:hypothetical protein